MIIYELSTFLIPGSTRYCTARRWRNKRIKQKIYTFEQIAQKIYFFVLLFCLLLHRLAVRISFPFIFFYKFNCTDPGLQLRRDGTTQRFVVVDLLTFYIFWNLLDIVHSGTIKERLIQKSITAKTDVPPRSSPLRHVSRGRTSATQPCSRFSDSVEDAKVKGTRKVGGAVSSRFIFSIQRARLSRSLEQASDSATEISYWWRNICPESGHKHCLDGPLMYRDASVSVFSIFNSQNGKLIFVERY